MNEEGKKYEKGILAKNFEVLVYKRTHERDTKVHINLQKRYFRYLILFSTSQQILLQLFHNFPCTVSFLMHVYKFIHILTNMNCF